MTSPEDRIVRSVLPAEAEGVRLDQYLAGRFTYRSRTLWQDWVRRGVLKLNGRRTRPSRVLHAGEIVSLDMTLEAVPEPPVRTDYAVLAETPDFLAVDKPGDLPVHPSGRYFNHTLQRLLLPRFGAVHPVNRLDRETSGIVLFARSGAAARKLAELFETGAIRKTYAALVFGDFPETLAANGFMSADPVSPVHKKRRFTFDLPAGAEAVETCSTDFVLRGRSDGLSLVECRPHTGRLHQLRATLFSLGFPLAGDKLYGPDDTIFLRFRADAMTDSDRARLRLERQALHAEKLEFVSPFTGEPLVFRSPLPPDMDAGSRIP